MYGLWLKSDRLYKISYWAKSRKGEIIFCKCENGDYLPFISLISLKGVAGKTSQEKIFYESYVQKIQPELFYSN
jgi:hypothetical protein